ncbi:MAG TPA: PIN domain-containing protein [Gemmataceae bacterium]|nr:PIN domain-containing protein [Gemmataceae bacterium]
MLIYCDSVILIYYLDHTGSFNMRARNRLATLAAAGDRVAISDLVRLEYRVEPVRTGDPVKLTIFDAFCGRPDVQLVPIATAVFDRATVIRARHNFKLGDSLHLAAAVEGGCHRFLTNDTRLSAFPDIPVEVLP